MRDQLEGLMERVEIEPTTSHGDSVAIRKVTEHNINLPHLYYDICRQ